MYRMAAWFADDDLGRRSLENLQRLCRKRQLTSVAGEENLWRACAGGAPHVLFVGPQALVDGGDHFLAAFRERFPTTAVIGFGNLDCLTARQLFDLSQSGLHEIITDGVDSTPLAFEERLTTALRRPLVKRVESTVRANWHARDAEIFLRLVPYGTDPLIPRVVARKFFHEHVTTINRRFRRTRSLSLGETLTWIRFLHVAALLETGWYTFATVASLLHFSSPSSLRNQLRRVGGTPPAGFRDLGLDHLLQRLTERCQEKRVSLAA